MLRFYHFLHSHKWILYLSILVTTALFVVLALQCRFEENIAKLLPPTDSKLNIDLAFSDLKVKDKLFVQVIPTDRSALVAEGEKGVNAMMLSEAMDRLMELTQANDHDSTILNVLYELEPDMLLDAALELIEMAPAYLDFTDEEMDSLTSVAHLTEQIAQYIEFLDTETGQNFYDIAAYDPCGIILSKLPFDLSSSNSNRPSSFYNNHFFAGNTCFGFITPNLSSMDSRNSNRLLKALRSAIKEVEKEYPQIEVYYHGTIVNSANNASRIRKDLFLTLGISLSVILLLLVVVLSQPSDLILLLVPIVYGALFSLGAMFVLQGGMSLMALGLGAIVMGVALSYCLHVVVHYKYAGNPEQTVREQSKPVFLGSLTTIGAFAGLVFTESALLRDFGWFAAFAMVGTTIAALVFLPHFFGKKNKRNYKAFVFLERVNTYEPDRRRWLMIIMLLYVVTTIAFSGRYTFDNNLKNINYLAPEAIESRQIWEEHHNGGCFQQYYAAYGKTIDEALTKLETLEAETDSLRSRGLITSVTKTSLFMPSLARQKERIDHWREYFSPYVAELVWERIEKACKVNDIDAEMFEPFKEIMYGDLEPELLSEAGIIPDNVLCNLVEKVNDLYLVFEPVRLDADNLPQVNETLTALDGCIVLDPFYYTTDLVELIHTDFNKILLVSSIFVFIVLLFSFRSFVLALIAFIPMFLSWYVVLGAMAISGQPFNLINIVVSSFIFGIGVDYSIFIMDGLLAKARGANTHLLTYHKTAITISATILTVCMASLLFAVHPSMKSIGFASLVGMITTISLSYTFEPWLFRQALKSKLLRRRLLRE